MEHHISNEYKLVYPEKMKIDNVNKFIKHYFKKKIRYQIIISDGRYEYTIKKINNFPQIIHTSRIINSYHTILQHHQTGGSEKNKTRLQIQLRQVGGYFENYPVYYLHLPKSSVMIGKYYDTSSLVRLLATLFDVNLENIIIGKIETTAETCIVPFTVLGVNRNSLQNSHNIGYLIATVLKTINLKIIKIKKTDQPVIFVRDMILENSTFGDAMGTRLINLFLENNNMLVEKDFVKVAYHKKIINQQEYDELQ